MSSPPPSQHVTQREIWLRRGTSANPYSPGQWHTISLSELGTAAARETFATATLPFAAAWTDLFQNMIAVSQELRWRENGPGVGRDARTAYSSLFGRYMARAYLTTNEGVRVLVPLDEAKHLLRETPYYIEKLAIDDGLEADWIGLDSSRRLVIAEAKGSFDKGVRAWSGPHYIPGVLRTAIGQARRTAVFRISTRRPLPAKRWAVASRWSNEDNKRRPTLLAWDPEEEELDDDDYRVLAKLLHRADIEGILKGLGHFETADTLGVEAPSRRLPGDLWLRIGDRPIEPGYAAVLGPIGSYPLRGGVDLDLVRLIRELTPNVALASLSRQYVSTIIRDPRALDDGDLRDTPKTAHDSDGRFAQQAGLTVAWPMPDEDIALAEE